MKTIFALSLASVCGAVSAQTPATNLMPDGSRDMYLGAGLVSTPLYPGARERRVQAVPLLQVEWSNGAFVSGLSAGLHWSHNPALEYGPLLAVHPGRDNQGIGSVTDPAAHSAGRIGVRYDGGGISEAGAPSEAPGMAGMDKVSARLQGGVFVNYYLSPALRMTSTVLYGAGRDRHGLAWSLGLQRAPIDITMHHRLTLAAGVTMVNEAHNARLFGVTEVESLTSGFRPYAPAGGLRDVSASAGWNWALSPAWMLASSVRVARLRGDARHSPLVQRPTSVTVSSGLAYRF